jgi:hypothetical protein
MYVENILLKNKRKITWNGGNCQRQQKENSDELHHFSTLDQLEPKCYLTGCKN